MRELVDKLRAETKLAIRLDEKWLGKKWIEGKARIAFSANDESLVRALRRALRPHNLAVVYSDPSFFVTTEEEAVLHPVTRIYPVHDLVNHLNADTSLSPHDIGDEMLEQLTANVIPHSWSEVGGSGNVEWLPNLQAVVVVQSLEGHERTDDFLNRIRGLVAINRDLQGKATPRGRLSHVAWDSIPPDFAVAD